MGRRIVALAVGLALGLAGTVVAQAPAHALVPNQYGFAFLHTPTPAPGTVLDPTRQWGTWKTLFPADFATVTEVAFGRYRVRFPHIASARGAAHATAVAGDARWCQVVSFVASGTDMLVDVQCYRHGGIADRSRFAVVYQTSSGLLPAGTQFGYVFSQLAGGTVNSYNSTGGVNVVTRIAAGNYRVTLPGLGGGGAVVVGSLQVTAVSGAPRRCKVVDWVSGGTGSSATVFCFNQANVLTDSQFTLTHQNRRAIFGGLAPPDNFAYTSTAFGPSTDFNSQGGVNTVAQVGVGQYLVQFPRVGFRETNVEATAVGSTPDYCNLQEFWILSGTTVIVRNVICWNSAGTQAPNRFLLTYTSRI